MSWEPLIETRRGHSRQRSNGVVLSIGRNKKDGMVLLIRLGDDVREALGWEPPHKQIVAVMRGTHADAGMLRLTPASKGDASTRMLTNAGAAGGLPFIRMVAAAVGLEHAAEWRGNVNYLIPQGTHDLVIKLPTVLSGLRTERKAV